MSIQIGKAFSHPLRKGQNQSDKLSVPQCWRKNTHEKVHRCQRKKIFKGMLRTKKSDKNRPGMKIHKYMYICVCIFMHIYVYIHIKLNYNFALFLKYTLKDHTL